MEESHKTRPSSSGGQDLGCNLQLRRDSWASHFLQSSSFTPRQGQNAPPRSRSTQRTTVKKADPAAGGRRWLLIPSPEEQEPCAPSHGFCQPLLSPSLLSICSSRASCPGSAATPCCAIPLTLGTFTASSPGWLLFTSARTALSRKFLPHTVRTLQSL